MDRLRAWIGRDSHQYSALPNVNSQDVHEKRTTRNDRNRSILKVLMGAMMLTIVLYFATGYM
jgi:hypothetical protein